MAKLEQGSRARLVLAGVLAVALVGAVLLVPLLVSGGGKQAAGAAPADPRCIEAWNSDHITQLLGTHLAIAHLYTRVEVVRLDDSGGPAASGTGNCAVVFASPRLDPEPGAAAQILLEGKWTPVSGLPGVDSQQLGTLQSEALSRANATLDTHGRLAPAAS
jgi:hypothetical protein